MSDKTNVLSLTVRGIKEGKKQRQRFQWLNDYKGGLGSVIFLQEIYGLIEDELIWKREWKTKSAIKKTIT